jgi:hypothetical protein
VAIGGSYPRQASFGLRHLDLRKRHPGTARVKHLAPDAAGNFLGEQTSACKREESQKSNENAKSHVSEHFHFGLTLL